MPDLPTPATVPAPIPTALHAGLAGALAMTVVHEVGRRIVPRAPRFDALGRRALARILRKAGRAEAGPATMQAIALGGDVASNTALFAAALVVGPPATAPARGLVVGGLAGLATLALPPRLGIGPRPGRLARSTQLMTVGLYGLGGLVAGLDYRRRRRDGGRGS